MTRKILPKFTKILTRSSAKKSEIPSKTIKKAYKINLKDMLKNKISKV